MIAGLLALAAAWQWWQAQATACREVVPGWTLAVGEARYSPWLTCGEVQVLRAPRAGDVLRDLLALGGQHC